jgi:hypothetical protein
MLISCNYRELEFFNLKTKSIEAYIFKTQNYTLPTNNVFSFNFLIAIGFLFAF